MDFSFLESIIYGLLTGFAEFLPVSAPAHGAMLMKIFGVQSENLLLRLLVHGGAFAALVTACRGQIGHIQREMRLARVPKRRRKRQPDQKIMLDVKIVRTALVPTLLGFLLFYFTQSWALDLSKIALFLALNGIVLFIPRLLSSGNKDSRSMSALDSLLIGVCGGLSMVPGLSRMGITTTAALARGADRQEALSWSLVLSIPVLACIIGIDIYSLISVGAAAVTFAAALQCLVAALASYCGAFAAITFMRFIAVKAGFSGFAYYSWGAALFAFILYMTI